MPEGTPGSAAEEAVQATILASYQPAATVAAPLSPLRGRLEQQLAQARARVSALQTALATLAAHPEIEFLLAAIQTADRLGERGL